MVRNDLQRYCRDLEAVAGSSPVRSAHHLVAVIAALAASIRARSEKLRQM